MDAPDTGAEEFREAAYWQAHGVLSQTACDWQRAELTERPGVCGAPPGVGIRVRLRPPPALSCTR
ncbi:hypothetical protein GCM10010424_09500 [Streptomyces lienomycini]